MLNNLLSCPLAFCILSVIMIFKLFFGVIIAENIKLTILDWNSNYREWLADWHLFD